MCKWWSIPHSFPSLWESPAHPESYSESSPESQAWSCVCHGAKQEKKMHPFSCLLVQNHTISLECVSGETQSREMREWLPGGSGYASLKRGPLSWHLTDTWEPGWTRSGGEGGGAFQVEKTLRWCSRYIQCDIDLFELDYHSFTRYLQSSHYVPETGEGAWMMLGWDVSRERARMLYDSPQVFRPSYSWASISASSTELVCFTPWCVIKGAWPRTCPVVLQGWTNLSDSGIESEEVPFFGKEKSHSPWSVLTGDKVILLLSPAWLLSTLLSFSLGGAGGEVASYWVSLSEVAKTLAKLAFVRGEPDKKTSKEISK